MAEQFIRAVTSCGARFRRVSGPDAPRAFARQRAGGEYGGGDLSGGAKLREELLRSGRQPDVVLRFLAEMDRKLDAILTLLQRDAVQESFPFQGRVVALSGTDLALESAEVPATGECLEVLIFLEEFPLRMVSVLGRVQGLLEPPDSAAAGAVASAAAGAVASAAAGAATWEVAFLSVEEEDREAIIRHVFSEERKRIRQRKGEDA